LLHPVPTAQHVEALGRGVTISAKRTLAHVLFVSLRILYYNLQMNEYREKIKQIDEHVPSQETHTVKSFILEVVKFVVLAIVIVIPIRVYIAQPYIVSGGSMNPTFEDGNYIIVDQLSYRLRTPEHGEVTVFRFPLAPSKFFIKRIIGLPGETVAVKNGVLTVTTSEGDASSVEEPYVKVPFNDTFTTTLGEEEYFVMGDNRGASLDSRSWGPLDERFIVGKALVRLFPFTEISLFPKKY